MPRLLIAANEAAMFRDFLNPFAAHFRAKGWTVHAAACDAAASLYCAGQYDHSWNIDWSRNPFSLANFTRAPRMVREAALASDYDLVHVHTPIPAFVTRYSLRQLRARGRPRIIYTAHGFHFHEHGTALRNALFGQIESIAGAWTDYLVVINRADHEAAERRGIVPRERLVYMPGIGLDPERYHPERVRENQVAEIREELRLRTDERLMLMIAEFTPGKRHRDAVRAIARTQDASIVLAFAGYGPLLETVRSQGRRLGVESRLRFLGYRSDIPTLIRAASTVLLPSEREGLPRSVMEALAMGTPVIGADVRGTRDLLADGAGVLFRLGDVGALCAAMQWVISHEAEARAMARRWRERIHLYDLRNILLQHEELYERALQGFSWNDCRTKAEAGGAQ